MKTYLIEFEYEYYCQGYEWVTTTVLVRDSKTFKAACKKISAVYKNAKEFTDKTID